MNIIYMPDITEIPKKSLVLLVLDHYEFSPLKRNPTSYTLLAPFLMWTHSSSLFLREVYPMDMQENAFFFWAESGRVSSYSE